ncbi:MAG: RHS repeat protein [Arthrobacter sp.]|nr:RHS repeat protein [Arthrobacter sp.]
MQSWGYRGGLLREHTRSRGGSVLHTDLGHDDEGRVASVSAGGSGARYSYDELGRRTRAIHADGSWEEYS